MKNELIQKMSYDEYASHGGLRASWLGHLKRSAAHLKVAMENPKPASPAMRLGKIIHAMIENGNDFLDTYVVEPEFTGKTKDGRDSSRSAEAKIAKQEWYAALPPDRLVITQEQRDVVIGVARSVNSSVLLTNMLRDSIRESSLFVDDPDTGLALQCRPDFVTTRGHCCDIKSTRNAIDFYNEIFSDKHNRRFYVLQAAHYTHCLKLAGICKSDSFVFVAIETEPPFGIKIYPLDIGCLGPGEQWREHLTKMYADCTRDNLWPCYPDRAEPVVPPEWVALPPELNL